MSKTKNEPIIRMFYPHIGKYYVVKFVLKFQVLKLKIKDFMKQ